MIMMCFFTSYIIIIIKFMNTPNWSYKIKIDEYIVKKRYLYENDPYFIFRVKSHEIILFNHGNSHF